MKNIILLDIDGTITNNGQPCEKSTIEYLKNLSKNIDIGVVSSSNLERIFKQIDDLSFIKILFPENGTIVYKDNKIIHKMESINLQYLDSDIKNILYFFGFKNPYIEYRNSLVAIFPEGRNCDRTYDKYCIIRPKIIEKLKEHLTEEFDFTIGGQTSFELFPFGLDKTYCLQFLSDYDKIYFLGDRTEPCGNDWHIFNKLKETSFTVKSVDDTIRLCNQIVSQIIRTNA
jgi:phosphomannomutase